MISTIKYEGKTVWVEANFERYGGVESKRILMLDVHITGGPRTREHVWIPVNSATQSQSWVVGQRYRFKAQVYHYQRGGYYDANKKEYVPIYWKLGLRRISDIREV
jgi:hypothetical protein